jgi:putative ABC transport system permease protein
MIRQLLRAPLFSTTVIITFAMTTAILAIVLALVWNILVRPLPFADAGRLVLMWNRYGSDPAKVQSSALSAPAFHDYRDVGAFERAAAARSGSGSLLLSEPVRVDVAAVTPGFLDVFGVLPVIGSGFAAGEEDAVLLSHSLWRERFGGRRDIVGRAIVLDGRGMRVAGVMPARFAVPTRDTQMWRPLLLTGADVADTNRANENLVMFARLRRGVGITQAQAQLDAVSRSVLRRVPERVAFLEESRWHVAVFGMRDDLVRRAKPALLMLLAAALLVTLLAASNVLGLILARTVARENELAVRTALGATRWSLVRALTTEVVILAVAGVAAGMIAARLILPRLALDGLPRAEEVRVDGLVATIAAAAVLIVAAAIGCAVGTWASGRSGSAPAGERASTGSVRTTRLRGVLVATQIAIAVTLLITGAMLLQTYQRIRQMDLGFDRDGLLTFAVELPRANYAEPPRRHAFFSELQQRLAALPGVVTASAVSDLPFSPNDWTGTFEIDGYAGTTKPSAHVRVILPEYTSAMRIPLLRGRMFTHADRAGSAPVAIIDDAAAKRYWPNQDPIGRRVRWGDQMREVVGVIGSIRTSSPADPAQPHLYMPLLQRSERMLYLVVRVEGDPWRIARAVRAVVRQLDAGQPIHAMRTMTDYIDDANAQPRLRAAMVAGAAMVAVVLALTGLYALLAYVVAARTRELGVRMALGATPAQMVTLIASWALRLSAGGTAAGIAGALAMTRSTRALLFGIDPLAPSIYLAVAAVITGAAALASAAPALRAARIDPAAALRSQ